MSIKDKVCRVQAYVSRDTERDLERHAAAHGQSKSSLVEAALRAYLDDTSDTALLFRRLDRHDRRIGKVGRDLELMAESFAVFVRLWFAHTPRVAEDQRDPARREAQVRFEQFCTHVADQLSGNARFLNDLAGDLPIAADALQGALNATDEPR